LISLFINGKRIAGERGNGSIFHPIGSIFQKAKTKIVVNPQRWRARSAATDSMDASISDASASTLPQKSCEFTFQAASNSENRPFGEAAEEQFRRGQLLQQSLTTPAGSGSHHGNLAAREAAQQWPVGGFPHWPTHVFRPEGWEQWGSLHAGSTELRDTGGDNMQMEIFQDQVNQRMRPKERPLWFVKDDHKCSHVRNTDDGVPTAKPPAEIQMDPSAILANMGEDDSQQQPEPAITASGGGGGGGTWAAANVALARAPPPAKTRPSYKYVSTSGRYEYVTPKQLFVTRKYLKNRGQRNLVGIDKVFEQDQRLLDDVVHCIDDIKVVNQKLAGGMDTVSQVEDKLKALQVWVKKLSENELKEDRAAATIQGMYRRRQARALLRQLIGSVYTKVWDEGKQKFYFYNNNTGMSVWDDPTKHMAHSLAKKPATTAEAASFIQGAWRKRKARQFFASLLQKTYKKLWSEEQQRYYYVNTKTGKVSWTRPKNVTDAQLQDFTAGKEEKPKKIIGSEVEAASMLQGAYRAKKAREAIQKVAFSRFRIAIDPSSDRTYYYNIHTKKTYWEKPSFFPSDAIIQATPRTQRVLEKRDTQKNRLLRFKGLAEEQQKSEAASLMQRMFRTRKARAKMKELIASVIDKVYDENSKQYFWYNKRTGTSSWTPPGGAS
jgi:hypothetical protein